MEVTAEVFDAVLTMEKNGDSSLTMMEVIRDVFDTQLRPWKGVKQMGARSLVNELRSFQIGT